MGGIDGCLAGIFGAEHLADTCLALADAAPPAVDTGALRSKVSDLDRKLDRYRQAIEASTDTTLFAAWVKEVNAVRVLAEAELAPADRAAGQGPTAAEIQRELEALGGMLQLLELADPALKARLYEAVGLEGTYDPAAGVVTVELRVLNGRVGGRTPPINSARLEPWTT